MSNTRRFNERLKKRRPGIEELEEVEVRDRRGNVRVGMQPVRPIPKPTLPARKRPRRKSPSPVAAGSKHPKTSRSSKSQNDFLREWIPKRDSFLHLLLELEGRPADSKCHKCRASEGDFRCPDCFGNLVHCQKCLIEHHELLPFHRIQRWNGEYFDRTTLFQQGYIMHLGHGGYMCPNNLVADDQWLDINEDHQEQTSSSARARVDDGVVDIVHTTGVFKTNVRWCQCKDASDKAMQLYQLGLFPASLHRPQTAFTFDSLKYFHIDAMECKTAAASFVKKVCRLTNNVTPHLVPNRERELRRVSRQWRDIQSRKQFGFGHTTKKPGNGDLAYFCPACPQPGINLPSDWKNHPQQWLFRRSVVTDGNFHADHLQMRNPEDDVSLADGLAFVVESKPYKEHLSESVEIKHKPTCHNYRAMNAANLNRKNRDATGVGACACARHGCFVPHTVVDFQKGERQMNIDYAICNALKYNSWGLLQALVIYDIGCQWIIHFLRRLKQSRHLSIPDVMTLLVAVGKFHLSAHVQECFVNYSLNFIYGSGQLDGEILETLWAPFNSISASARTMSMASRHQLYDDHMRDSNWKKIVGIVNTLRRKLEKAKAGIKETSDGYHRLSAVLKSDLVESWKKEEEEARVQRGDSLKIYDIKLEQAPSQADIRLMLTAKEGKKGMKNGTITWLALGISLEDLQDNLRSDVRTMSKRATVSERTFIEDRRRKLENRLNNFHQKAEDFMGDCGDEEMEILPQFTGFDIGDEDGSGSEDSSSDDDGSDTRKDEDDDGSDTDGDVAEFPENTPIWMPSSLQLEDIERLGLKELAAEELELRQGQANDCLMGLRMALGHKAVLYRTKVRSASTSIGKTRAWKDIKMVSIKVNMHMRTYRRARNAMVRLGADDLTLQQYQEIQREDLRLSGDITEENRHGQRTDILPWFWRLEGQNDDQNDTWMEEFYRVNWLRAKARFDRWEEELLTVRHEMKWSTLWFKHQKNRWMARGRRCENKPGHKAYAMQQVAMWKKFAERAESGFAGQMAE